MLHVEQVLKKGSFKRLKNTIDYPIRSGKVHYFCIFILVLMLHLTVYLHLHIVYWTHCCTLPENAGWLQKLKLNILLDDPVFYFGALHDSSPTATDKLHVL